MSQLSIVCTKNRMEIFFFLFRLLVVVLLQLWSSQDMSKMRLVDRSIAEEGFCASKFVPFFCRY